VHHHDIPFAAARIVRPADFPLIVQAEVTITKRARIECPDVCLGKGAQATARLLDAQQRQGALVVTAGQAKQSAHLARGRARGHRLALARVWPGAVIAVVVRAHNFARSARAGLGAAGSGAACRRQRIPHTSGDATAA